MSVDSSEYIPHGFEPVIQENSLPEKQSKLGCSVPNRVNI